jgi:predicted nucleic acid-binding protein
VSSGTPIFVLDSFALLAFFQDEPAADEVESLLGRALRGEVRLAMTVANLGEVVYRTIREHGFERAQEVLGHIEQYDIDMVDVDRELALMAAYVKGTHRISYADCFAVALAQRLDAAVVTGDPDFAQAEDAVRIEWLPTPERQ